MEKRKSKKSFRLLFFIALAFIGLILSSVWFTLLRPSPQLWNKEGRVNLFVNSKPALILSFNSAEESLIVLSLPEKTLMDATGGYGNYLLAKIPQLDKLEKKQGKLIVNSVSEFLGLPFDGYLDLEQKELSPNDLFSREEFLQVKEEILNFQSVFSIAKSTGRTNSNLELRDLFQAYFKFNKIGGGKLMFVDLAQKYVLRAEKLPDSTDVLIGDPEVVDSGLGNLFNEPGIIQERLKSEILNSTGYPGLAEKAARLVTNVGGQVINTGNFFPALDRCRIYTPEENSQSYTVRRLARVLNCEIVKQKMPESRADFSLVIGKDYLEMLVGN